MVAIKAHLADRTIEKPPKEIVAYLVYGTDEGRISETALNLARNWSSQHGENGEIIQIDETALADNPDLLAIEIRSTPMFGGFNVVRIKLSNRIKPNVIKELVELRPQNLLIMEAGNLKPSSAMRKLFEKTKGAAAIPCFPDEVRDLSHLIDREIIQKGFTLSSPARKLLVDCLGADRGISRQELVKLALYADGKNEITREDVLIMIGDSSQLAYDQLISFIMNGQSKEALNKLERLLASGQTGAGLTIILARHLLRLLKIRSLIETGRSAKEAVASLRPPVHFRQKEDMIQQAAKFSLANLKRSIHLVQETVARTRSQSYEERIALERMILILSTIAKK